MYFITNLISREVKYVLRNEIAAQRDLKEKEKRKKKLDNQMKLNYKIIFMFRSLFFKDSKISSSSRATPTHEIKRRKNMN
jgi:hypothetical protein